MERPKDVREMLVEDHNKRYPAKLDRWHAVCSKCGQEFSAAQQYRDHRQLGYPCGPVAR